MRNALALLLFAVLATATFAGSAPSTGQLASDAPVLLYGGGAVEAAQIRVHHFAFRDGSISGDIDVGRLWDHEVVEVAYNQPPECYGFAGTTDDLLLSFNATEQPENRRKLQLVEGGLAILHASGAFAFMVGEPPADSDDELFAYLGPNPYAYEGQQLPSENPPDEDFAPAFPNTTFAAAPTPFTTATPYTLELHWGSLRLQRLTGQTATYEAGVRESTRYTSFDPSEIPPRTPVECRLHEVHVLQFELLSAATTIDQDGLDRAVGFWNGQAPEDAFAQAPPPEGYWDRSRPEGFPDALVKLRLPATLVAAEGMAVTAKGRALFDDALGSVAVGSTIHRAETSDTTVVGNLRLTPETAGADGRQMTTRVGGDVSDVQILGAPKGESFLDAYGAFLWGGVGGAGLLGAAYFAWPSAKFGATQFLLLPLYARLKKEDILENPLRDDILEAVDSSPGISASELGRRLSCGWGTLVYHLTVLERMQLISSAREGRHRRFFVQGRINYSDKGAAGLLANPASRVILDAIRDTPGLIQRDLSRRIGLSAGTIAWHVERMENVGLIIKEEDGRVVRYYPSTKLVELTQQMAA